jgi:hypothetical protein
LDRHDEAYNWIWNLQKKCFLLLRDKPKELQIKDYRLKAVTKLPN